MGKSPLTGGHEKRLLFRANSDVICCFEFHFAWMNRHKYSACSIFWIDPDCNVVRVALGHQPVLGRG